MCKEKIIHKIKSTMRSTLAILGMGILTLATASTVLAADGQDVQEPEKLSESMSSSTPRASGKVSFTT